MAIQFVLQPAIRIEPPFIGHHYIHGRSPFALNPQKFSICCNKIAASPTSDLGVVKKLFSDKYGLTEENIAKAFKQCDNSSYSTGNHNVEQALQLLHDHGLKTSQIRKVIIYNPKLFLQNPDKNIKPKLNFLKEFVREKDMAKLISLNPRLFNLSIENRLKPAVSLVQKWGFKGERLSKLLATAPYLLTLSEDEILRLLKQVEAFGYTKGSPLFAIALGSISRLSEDFLEQKLQNLCSLGFSEGQVWALCRRMPRLIAFSKEKIKRNLEFLVHSAGLRLSDIVKYPYLLAFSVEVRLIPRYRVVEALKSMEKGPPSFPKVVSLTEECFFEKYVQPYAESSFLQKSYRG